MKDEGAIKKNNNLVKSSSKYLLLPLVIIMAIIPLIVKLKVYENNLSEYTWFSSDSTSMDFFLYYKSQFFIIVCVVIFCIIMAMLFSKKKNIKFSKLFIPLFGYAAMVILSMIFSKYKVFGINGIYEQFESVFVLLGYCFACYYAFLVINTEEDIKFVMKWWAVGIFIMCLLGLTQFLGFDFYGTDIGKALIAPGIEKLRFNFPPNRVYLSLYNPNYVGTYAGLIVPILVVMILSNKNKKYLLTAGILLLGVLLCVLGAQSKSAIVALAVVGIFLIVIFRRALIKRWKIILPVVILFVITFLITLFRNDISFMSTLKNIFNPEKIEYSLSEIRTNQENVEFDYRGNTLKVSFEIEGDVAQIHFVDQTGASVASHYDETKGCFVLDDERFPNFETSLGYNNEILGFKVMIDGEGWTFSNLTGKVGYYYFNRFGKWDKIEPSESAVFTNMPNFATNRGYLWSKTFPILKENWLLGLGPDTYVLEYPHNDYVANYNHGYGFTMVTKPHNMYLQIASQTGVVSLIFIIIFFVWYLVRSLMIYWKCKFCDLTEQIGVGIFLSTIAFLVLSITNDSSIGVSMIFWVLIGIGISLNETIAKKMKQTDNEAVN